MSSHTKADLEEQLLDGEQHLEDQLGHKDKDVSLVEPVVPLEATFRETISRGAKQRGEGLKLRDHGGNCGILLRVRRSVGGSVGGLVYNSVRKGPFPPS